MTFSAPIKTQTQTCWSVDSFFFALSWVLPEAFQLSLLHPFGAAPLCSPGLYHLLGAPLHSAPSSFSPHLPVFCALSTFPPAVPVLVRPCPLFSVCPPFPLLCYPLTSLPASLPFPFHQPHPAPPHAAAGTPKSSCSSLDCFPFRFLLGG